MSPAEFVDADTWAAARADLLAAEKQLTADSDALAARRRAMPWREITADYRFDGLAGSVGLADLFGTADQLVVMHFMYGLDWGEGCPSCSFWADTYDGTMEHLTARNTSYVCISNAPVAELAAYQQRMGWSFPWYSSGGTAFGGDFGVNPPVGSEPGAEWLYNGRPMVADEMPGISVFATSTSHPTVATKMTCRGRWPGSGVTTSTEPTADDRHSTRSSDAITRRAAGTYRYRLPR